MIKVVGVRFKKAGKIYYFGPNELNINKGDYVVVETARGVEFGECVIGIKEIKEEDVIPPLKSVLRIADENDIAKHKENKITIPFHKYFIFITPFFLMYKLCLKNYLLNTLAAFIL